MIVSVCVVGATRRASPCGLPSWMMTVSDGSAIVSGVVCTVIVCVVWPRANDSVPVPRIV